MEVEKQLNILCTLTNVTLATSKNEPQNYKKLIEDLKNAEDIRKKEAQIISEKVQLQEKFGTRFQQLETNWQEIVTVLEWCKMVQAAFIDIPVPRLSQKSPLADQLQRLQIRN
jgi:hypothetical protein